MRYLKGTSSMLRFTFTDEFEKPHTVTAADLWREPEATQFVELLAIRDRRKLA